MSIIAKHLTRLHVIADVIGQVSGDFGEEIRLLEGASVTLACSR
jgi:hypothetical protein